MAEPLSPAAQAVVDAWDAKLNPDPDGLTYLTHDPEREALAAALVAAADQVVPSDAMEPRNYIPMAIECQRIRLELLAIAAELMRAADSYSGELVRMDEGRVQRGNGNGGPSTPKPPIKPQPSGGHLIRKGQLWGGYQPRPQSGTPSAPPESP